MVEKPNLSICIREYIDLRIKPLEQQYNLSEARLKDTKDEMEKRLEATYATIREVDAKIEKALTRIYEVIVGVFLLLMAAFVAHLMGKV
ncbi:hypothetical protein M0R72_15025 [Candidatus Pacearchaeota archaeon]|jgi:tetrahydromethanopterin S-methyltransferase subunit G|nr:hypothetical protein [Candidatus Pacearchaeota archaeon]